MPPQCRLLPKKNDVRWSNTTKSLHSHLQSQIHFQICYDTIGIIKIGSRQHICLIFQLVYHPPIRLCVFFLQGHSERQVQRYIRLTELIPEILKMVDDGKIALTPAVELSYLRKQEQRDLLETMESEDRTPSLSHVIQMKKLSQLGFLNMDKIFEILRAPKANRQDKISFRVDDLRKHFPKSYTASRIQDHILKLLEADLRKRQREQSR